jgi:hypothetical protein
VEPHYARYTNTSSTPTAANPFPTVASVIQRIINKLDAGDSVQSCAARLMEAAQEALRAGKESLRNWHRA